MGIDSNVNSDEEDNMPQKVTQNYRLTGWATVTLYSESEMAEALGLTREEFRRAMEDGTSGRAGIAYHGNPLNTYNREYTFLEKIYFENIKKWECFTHGGHHLEFAGYYDKHASLCKWTCRCGYTKFD
jgi:hypothetical protein